MPVFIRPGRVIVDDGPGQLPAILAIVGLVLIVSGASALIADVLDAILICLGVAVAGSLAILAIVLLRHGTAIAQGLPARAWAPAATRSAQVAESLSAPQPLAIEAAKPRATGRSTGRLSGASEPQPRGHRP